jgi:hypothetical protein
MRFFVPLILAFTAAFAAAADYQSHFGFSFQLPADWVVLTPQEAAKLQNNATPQDVGLPGLDAKALEGTLAKVRAGQVEYYFDRKNGTANWSNNINVQMGKARSDSMKDVAAECPSLEGQLRSIYGPGTKLTACGLKSESGVDYLGYEYRVGQRDVTIVQYEIPFGARGTLLVTGGSNDAGLGSVKEAQNHIARQAIQHSKTLEPAGGWSRANAAPLLYGGVSVVVLLIAFLVLHRRFRK